VPEREGQGVSLTPEERNEIRKIAGVFHDDLMSTEHEHKLARYALRLLAEIEEMEKVLQEKVPQKRGATSEVKRVIEAGLWGDEVEARRAQEALDDLIEAHERYQPVIAALAIYGEQANLAALVEKVRTFPEAKREA
jgi:hypothetical protein